MSQCCWRIRWQKVCSQCTTYENYSVNSNCNFDLLLCIQGEAFVEKEFIERQASGRPSWSRGRKEQKLDIKGTVGKSSGATCWPLILRSISESYLCAGLAKNYWDSHKFRLLAQLRVRVSCHLPHKTHVSWIWSLEFKMTWGLNSA